MTGTGPLQTGHDLEQYSTIYLFSVLRKFGRVFLSAAEAQQIYWFDARTSPSAAESDGLFSTELLFFVFFFSSFARPFTTSTVWRLGFLTDSLLLN